MATCNWCNREMKTASSCSMKALHLGGRSIQMIPHYSPPSARTSKCDDCGVAPGGWHHPGCDMQRCPICRGQMLSCGCRFDEDGPDVFDADGDLGLGMLGVDASGFPTEAVQLGGQSVIVHYGEVPDDDLTTIREMRCTTPVRTVIDIAADMDTGDLREMIEDALERGLLTRDELVQRMDRPDMATHPGAAAVRRTLPDVTG